MRKAQKNQNRKESVIVGERTDKATYLRLHGMSFQKMVPFMFTSVRTSYLADYAYLQSNVVHELVYCICAVVTDT
jgi:hypothetical protein